MVINGTSHTLRLTLGALAALEARLETDSLMGLAERFDSGRVGSAELIALLSAGLAGGGYPFGEEDLASADIEGGVVVAMRAGIQLLSLAFQPFQADG